MIRCPGLGDKELMVRLLKVVKFIMKEPPIPNWRMFWYEFITKEKKLEFPM
jgi:hypothetical protein